jgi:FAD binding domain
MAKVSSPRSADSSGIFRRPRVVVRVKRVEDLPVYVGTAKAYPSPVRALGADYSQTRCAGADGGTTLDTSPLNKILEIEGNHVRVQAGVRLGTLVRALAERGLELPLTPEIGNISVGALATTVLPQPSFQDGQALMSSAVAAIRLVTPTGQYLTVTEKDAELLRVMRSSYGLLGVVYEVILKIRDLTPLKLDYQTYTLKDFAARFTHIVSGPGALRLHMFPFNDRITVERRTRDEDASISRSGIWQIRSSVMRNVLPAFGSSVSSVLAAPGLRYMVLSGVQRAMHATLDRASRGVVMYAHEWMRELPRESYKARFTYSLWGFPQESFPQLLTQYFKFCRAYYKQHRYRCNVMHSSMRLHRDRSALFSPSYNGPAFTLEPSSTGDDGWDDFLIDFNEFASAHGGTPTFNQTRALQPEHIAKAFGERLKLFRALRQRGDTINRLRNSYFAHLLG